MTSSRKEDEGAAPVMEMSVEAQSESNDETSGMWPNLDVDEIAPVLLSNENLSSAGVVRKVKLEERSCH